MQPMKMASLLLTLALHSTAYGFTPEELWQNWPDERFVTTPAPCVRPAELATELQRLANLYPESMELEEIAKERGLLIGIEYHKRFDRRALLAKKEYEKGAFGEFIMGEARLIEPYLYRHSNFQNWFTCDKTDPFVYVGCHYVDLVCFVTGLKPTAVSVSGVKGKFPNGNEGYMWANGRVIYENGAILSVTDGLGYPDCFTLWYDVLDNCEAAGVVLTWSAGNEGPGADLMARTPNDPGPLAWVAASHLGRGRVRYTGGHRLEWPP